MLSLPGVGSKMAARLEKLGIRSILDLLFHLPFRYEDRTRVFPIGALLPGQKAQIEGSVEWAEIVDRPRRTLLIRIADESGLISLRFFYFNAAQKYAMKAGQRLRCFGEVRAGYAGLEMIHPEYQLASDREAGEQETELTPIYHLTEGIRQPLMRRLIGFAIARWKASETLALSDWLPAQVLKSMGFPSLESAVSFLHGPPSEISEEELSTWTHPAQRRLIFEELVAHYLCLSVSKQRNHGRKARVFLNPKELIQGFFHRLPFQPTVAQLRVIAEINSDLQSGRPMMRLVHGDVGSGKTLVAACAALTVLAAKAQVAVMAPTELLVEQHGQNFRVWLEPLGFRVGLLSSNQSEKNRRETLRGIQNRELDLVIGTHALFQDAVEFSDIGLVIIDEQHRFGVHQRLALRDKAIRDGHYPHQLVMTATPIPRTLAMLRFADFDISVIDELPPGRTPVTTLIIPSSRRDEVIDRIADWVRRGHQAYWVCTLIEESEFLQCEAAENTRDKLAEALPGVSVALVHGKMNATDKESVMMAFKQQAVDLLVATTVIEVGVDVPNAGLMVVENPERLGLAQLHQLRGRVGRGGGESFCVLLFQAPLSRLARERLSIMRESNDGFRIAEKDLELRGPGDVFGTRQTGQIQFKLADLARDHALMEAAVAAAKQIQLHYPNHVEPLIQRWIGDASQFTDV